jgi:hypothetical protein
VWSKALKAGALPGRFQKPFRAGGFGQLPAASAAVFRLRSEELSGGAYGGRFRPFAVRVRHGLGSLERQEGKGAGDGVRLHGRSKALKGATPRADVA